MNKLLAIILAALMIGLPSAASAQHMDINAIIAGIGGSDFLKTAAKVASAAPVRVVRWQGCHLRKRRHFHFLPPFFPNQDHGAIARDIAHARQRLLEGQPTFVGEFFERTHLRCAFGFHRVPLLHLLTKPLRHPPDARSGHYSARRFPIPLRRLFK